LLTAAITQSGGNQLCDDNNAGDGIEIFDHRPNQNEISNGQTNVSIPITTKQMRLHKPTIAKQLQQYHAKPTKQFGLILHLLQIQLNYRSTFDYKIRYQILYNQDIQITNFVM
jgi:hypothetical protein